MHALVCDVATPAWRHEAAAADPAAIFQALPARLRPAARRLLAAAADSGRLNGFPPDAVAALIAAPAFRAVLEQEEMLDQLALAQV